MKAQWKGIAIIERGILFLPVILLFSVLRAYSRIGSMEDTVARMRQAIGALAYRQRDIPVGPTPAAQRQPGHMK